MKRKLTSILSAVAVAVTLLILNVPVEAATSFSCDVYDVTGLSSWSYDEVSSIGKATFSTSVDVDGTASGIVVNVESDLSPADGYDAVLTYAVQVDKYDETTGTDDYKKVGTATVTVPVYPGYTFSGATLEFKVKANDGRETSIDKINDEETIISQTDSSITVRTELNSVDHKIEGFENNEYEHSKIASVVLSVKKAPTKSADNSAEVAMREAQTATVIASNDSGAYKTQLESEYFKYDSSLREIFSRLERDKQ